MVNFLSDSSQNPHIIPDDLYQWFGISAIRQAPLGAQIEAFRKGLIPYLPGRSREDSEAIAATIQGIIPNSPAQPKNSQSAKKQTSSGDQESAPGGLDALYVLDVMLLGGPVTEKFAKKNPQVIRTIEIRGDQTLADLHKIIFKAFDRKEEHMYEFQLKGARPNDPDADRYGLAMAMEDDFDGPMAGDVAQTRIGTLGLAVEEPFGYWFDFGDDWWHQVEVKAITKPQPKVKYPRIIDRVGASPPQYADFD